MTVMNIKEPFNLTDSFFTDQSAIFDDLMTTTFATTETPIHFSDPLTIAPETTEHPILSNDPMITEPETAEPPVISDDSIDIDPEPTNPPILAPVDCKDPLTVCFKNNSLTEFPANDIPQNTTTVKLVNNNISKLQHDVLDNLTSLETLVLSNNNIIAIATGVFLSQKKLKHLDLGDNGLTEIRGDMWVGLVSLETLRISGNKLQSLPSDAFSNLPELKILGVEFTLLELEKQKLFDPNTFPDSTKQPQIGLEQDNGSLVCNSSNCWLKEKEEKGLLEHYKRNGRPFRPKCSDKPGFYWDHVDLKCSGKYFIATVEFFRHRDAFYSFYRI